MFIRALTAFLALPWVFAFVLPLWIVRFDFSAFSLIGLPVLVPGIILLFWCVRDFYVIGKGTLAPWTPPQNLVVVGLYRFSRNPMYIAVTTILFGWALGFYSPALLIYALIVVTAFHLRVLLGEEPWLARKHGQQWERYKGKVPRWLF